MFVNVLPATQNLSRNINEIFSMLLELTWHTVENSFINNLLLRIQNLLKILK